MKKVSEQFSDHVIDMLDGPDRPGPHRGARRPRAEPAAKQQEVAPARDGETLEMFPVEKEEDLPACTRVQVIMLRALLDTGPLAWAEIVKHTGLKPQTVSPRLRPLRAKGLIEASGEKFGGFSGAKQMKWRLTRLGRRVLAERHAKVGDEPTALRRPDAVTTAMVDTLTLEDFKLILGEKGVVKLHGWFKRRMKRAIRLITEGQVYDDPGDDGAKTPRQIKTPIPYRRRDRLADLRNLEARKT